MSRLILNEQASVVATPSAGKVAVFMDNTGKPIAKMVDDLGNVSKFIDNNLLFSNFSNANQTGFAADTYLAGSSIAIPAGRLAAAGFTYKLRFDMVKTAAGAATPILTIRFGTAGAIGDTARLTFTFAIGTAAIDTGMFEAVCHFRNVGASAVLVGVATLIHALAATGLTTTGTGGAAIFNATSATFDSTVPLSFVGASFNGGASFSGTNVLVQAEAANLGL